LFLLLLVVARCCLPLLAGFFLPSQMCWDTAPNQRGQQLLQQMQQHLRKQDSVFYHKMFSDWAMPLVCPLCCAFASALPSIVEHSVSVSAFQSSLQALSKNMALTAPDGARTFSGPSAQECRTTGIH